MATTEKSFSKLTGTTGSFNKMLRRFGVVTVMNAYVYEAFGADTLRDMKAVDVLKTLQDENGKMKEESVTIGTETVNFQCKLDTLKIANVTIDGPSKTITGGQYANPLIKYGKTGRLEMQDALGNADAIEALCGGIIEHFGSKNHTDESHSSGATDVLHFGSDFCGEKLIVGDSFFVDTNGNQIKVKIIFYRFLPDSIFSLTQDSEGDATVFDMNGDLLTTDILVGNADGKDEVHGVFYSILPYGNVKVSDVSSS